MDAGSSLGSLGDPTQHRAPLALDNQPTEALMHSFREMMRIRLAEECVADLVTNGEAK